MCWESAVSARFFPVLAAARICSGPPHLSDPVELQARTSTQCFLTASTSLKTLKFVGRRYSGQNGFLNILGSLSVLIPDA